jgi:hypothetical protein
LAAARTCNDCYFRRKGLCALARTEPCPTFRESTATGMAAPKHPVLVPLQRRGEESESLTATR